MAGKNLLRKDGATLPAKQSATANVEQKPSILPLTPKYDETSHKVYVVAINEALVDKQIHNIALSGHYGVGKSSILSKVAEDNNELGVVSMSLSSLRVDSNGSEETKTNQIQKEIVKQLLYREAPSTTPESRYKRLAKYDWKKGSFPAAILTLFLYLALHVAGLTAKLIPFPGVNPLLLITQYVGLYILLSFLLLFLHATTFNRIWIDKVTTGSTTLSLAKPTDTYFDEFLDELVYFFEVSEAQVVIFEDLDRFNDPIIFENLRALNSLLNNSKQLKGRSIRFIYAIRDSIFESLSAEVDDQLARSNRTKFFDIVVPVVPFITHSNARDLMTSVMGDVEHGVSERLVRIAARHVTDMRVLKNVRNEFLIFREKIFGNSDQKNTLGLSEENLYAMILYKNTHLGDFEKISTADSDLDHLYRTSRFVVNAEVKRLTVKEAEANRQLANLDSISVRSQRLGTKLINALDCLQGLVISPSRMTARTATVAGSTVEDDELGLESTWTALTTASEALTVTFTNSSGNRVVMSFSSSDLETLLGESLSADSWQKVDRTKLEEQIHAIRTEVEGVRQADIADLIRLNPNTRSTDVDNSNLGFRDYVLSCLKSELARELAANGFIDRNFTLYTSVYHGVHVSVPAKNFLMKCIDQQVMDAEFTLENGDVEAVLNETSEGSLAFRGAYNVNLLDFLLETGDKRGGILVGTLARLGDDERKFLGSYWIRGQKQLKLASELGRLSPNILTYLVSDESVPEIISLPDQVVHNNDNMAEPLTKVHLVDQALRDLGSSVKYAVSAEVSSFLSANVKNLTVLSESLPDDYSLEPLVTVIGESGVKFHDLSEISESLLGQVIRLWAYALTRENVLLAIGKESGISLDAIRAANGDVYDYVLANISVFLDLLTEEDVSISDQTTNEESVVLLNDVVKEAPKQFAMVLDRAAQSWKVQEIANIDVKTWGMLAKRSMFPASYENVRLFRDQIGIDDSIAQLLLTAQKFEDRVQTDDDEYEASVVALAQELIGAKQMIPQPLARVTLADSLNIKNYLVFPDPFEAGGLAGHMIENDLIDDSLGTFQLLVNASVDWPTMEFAISKSTKYAQFVTPGILQPQYAQHLLESHVISDDLKRVIVSRSPEFLDQNSYQAQVTLAREASRLNIPLAIDVIQKMAAASVDSAYVLPLITPQLSSIDLTQLTPILTALGGDYAKISARSYNRPKFSKGQHIEALVGRLFDLGIVSSVEDKGPIIKVNMKHP